MKSINMICMFIVVISSCTPGPELHLHDGMAISIEIPLFNKTIDELWDYDLSYITGTPSVYNWRSEWKYGWDDQDERENGPIGYKSLRQYQIRRYYLGDVTYSPHDYVREDYCLGNLFKSSYNFGYYDILLWNDPESIDDVDSNHFEEPEGGDVTCYTNASMNASRYDISTSKYAYYAPDELFSAYQQGMYISKDPSDYDGYDELEDVYTKSIDFMLEPRTFIYLTQLLIHNNQGRVVGTGGVGMMSGMARSTNVTTGNNNSDAVTVAYSNRLKLDIDIGMGRRADVIGGRLVTFGICNINPNHISYPKEIPGYENERHLVDVNLIFYNGCDTTLVFDVTDKVLERFKGGVITFEVDIDTIPIPTRSGGSGFNAGVDDYQNGGTHEIPI